MTILISGDSGLIGRSLVSSLLAQKKDLVVFSRTRSQSLPSEVSWHGIDICESQAVSALIKKTKPTTIYHLAAQSRPALSWRNPTETFQINVNGTINILDAVREHAPKAKIIFAGSSAEYARSDNGEVIDEKWPTAPSSPYGASKLAAWHLSRMYFETHAVKVLGVRPFQLIGPGKTGDVFFDFTCKIIEARENGQVSIRVGSVDVVRDFLDVRDGVAALTLLADKGGAGELYNICSGIGHTLHEVLTILIKRAGIQLAVEVEPTIVRPGDEKKRIGDNLKLRALGWKPQYSLEETVHSIFDYWEKELPKCKL